jgi:hypothetical protein
VEIIRSISLYCETKGLKFLLAGGHAVNYYGISRQTGDIDLIANKDAKKDWLELLGKLDYTSFQDDDRFSRFKSNYIAAWPIDLMYVDTKTFETLLTNSKEGDLGVVKARFVSAKHLATLKIHALKHYQPHREPKDYGDLLALLETNQTGFTEDELKAVCLRYANLELYDRINLDLKRKKFKL